MRLCAHCWFNPRALAEPVPPWSGVLVHLVHRCLLSVFFVALRYPFAFMIPLLYIAQKEIGDERQRWVDETPTPEREVDHRLLGIKPQDN